MKTGAELERQIPKLRTSPQKLEEAWKGFSLQTEPPQLTP